VTTAVSRLRRVATVVHRPLAANVAWASATQVGSLLLGGISTILIARLLGPQQQGLFTLALLVPAVLGMLVECGVGPATTYRVAVEPRSLPAVTSFALWFALCGSAVGVTLGLGAWATGLLAAAAPGLTPLLILTGLALLPLTLLRDAGTALIRGLHAFRTLGWLTLAQDAVATAGVVVVVTMAGRRAEPALTATVVAAAAGVLLVGHSLRRAGARWRARGDRSLLRTSLGYGALVQVGSLVQLLNYRLDVFFVAHFSSTAAVGIYAVSTRMAELLWVLPGALGTVVFPATAQDQARMVRITPRAFWATLAFSISSAAVLAAGCALLLSTVFGPAYTASLTPLLLLLPGAILLGPASIIAQDLAGRGIPALSTASAAASLVVTLGLDVLLVPGHGAAGAAIASSCSYAVYAACLGTLYLRHTATALRTFLGAARWWSS
jgi:O-antigen/teichoic acid export membrane protein